MRGYLLRRLAVLPLVLLGVSLLSFGLLNLAPGDPAEITIRARQPGIEPSREAIVALRTELRLDEPAAIRFAIWFVGALRGDLGSSHRTGNPVTQEVGERLPATLVLGGMSLALAAGLGVPLGVLAAIRPGSWLDAASRMLAVVGASIPSYALSLALIVLFAVQLRWLPSTGFGEPRHLILPCLSLAAGVGSQLMRLTRASVLEVLHEGYIMTARAKGLGERRVIGVHALSNALLSVITILGTSLGHLLGGAVIVETIFGWPGVGKYAVDAILLRDYPAIQGFVLYLGMVFVLLNTGVDLSYRWLDPRLRLGEQSR